MQGFELSKLLHKLADAAIVMDVDTGCIVLWNHTAEEMFGYSAQEAIGQPVTRLMPEDMKARHDAGLAAYRKTGRGELIDSPKPMELVALRRSGEPFAIELTLSRCDEIELPGRFVLALVRDVSERHRANARIKTSEARLAEAQQLAHLGWWEWDLRLDRVEWSDELYRILGQDRRTFAVSYDAFLTLVHPADRPIVQRNIEGILRDHRPFVYQARILCPNGTIRTVEARGQLEVDSNDNRPARMLGTVQDVTDQIAAESALRRSNTLLRAQREAAIDGILVVDERREVVGYNQRFLELWQLSEVVMAGCSIQALLEALRPQIADWEGYLERVKYLYEHPMESSRDEIRLNDGRVFDRYTAPAHSRQGEYFGRVWYFRDMTERKRMEDELREKERRFRGIFNQTYQFIGLLDPDGCVIDINQTALDSAGIRLPDVVDRPFWQTAWWSHSPPLQERLKAAIRAASQGRFDRFEATHQTAEGRQLTIDFSLKPIEDETGRVVMLIPEGRDITERKQMEEDLKESEQRFCAIFEGTGVGIVLVSLDGAFIETNRAYQEMLGYSDDELRHMRFADLTHPDDVEISRQRFQELLTGQLNYYKLEKRYLRKDGRIVWASLMVYLIRSRENKPSQVLAIIEDISDRKRLEEALRQQYNKLKELDQLKSEFVNAVSHDLRTPLTAIFGYAEFLEDEIAGPLIPAQREFVLQIQKNGRRLERLLNDLLDFARFEAGTFKLNPESFDFGARIRDVVDSLRPQVETGKLHLELALPDGPILTHLDPERIERVFFNLLSNAVKFTPEGGTIRVTADIREGQLHCAVTDTGSGIAPEDLPKLFRRFSQLEQGKRKKGGTGLGLSISKAIIEAHGGTIGVFSELGAGSTFWFRIPLELTPERPPENMAAS